MGKGKFMNRSKHKDTNITEGYWKTQLDNIHQITALDILNKFEHDHETGIMQNYKWVVLGESGKHIGPPWYDGLIYEVIRGVSDIIAVSKDEYLENKMEYYADRISEAQNQDSNGYINTYTTLVCPDKRWGKNGGSLIWQHEIYNMGCLVDAGIHYYNATGKIKLLICGIKAADCMCKVMGPEPLENIVPAHSLAEEALVKLYCLLKEDTKLRNRIKEEYEIEVIAEKYLKLVCFWMDHRGVHYNRASFPHYMGEYSQDHCPIEEQSEAVGHAVRAALMYTGLVAVGIETSEDRYLDAAKRIWDNVEKTKLHISGGIGAIHNEERFGYQYDLPNDAYLETCAGVALAFWSGEMYRAFGSSNYMDVFEWVLYNNVMSGLSLDGTHYFYENPLISDGTMERWSWHTCPCCPPMFLKLLGSLQDYIYAYDSEKIVINLHIGSRVKIQMHEKEIIVEQKNCELPWHGKNRIVVYLEEKSYFQLAVRKPAWANEFAMHFDGKCFDKCDENGYIIIEKEWKNGDFIDISMELQATKVEAHPYISADIGKIALTRGPLLYCLEEIDNREGVDVVLDEDVLKTNQKNIAGVETIAITGKTAEGGDFTAIPYYLWNNRGKSKMNVWVQQKKNGQLSEVEKDIGLDGYAAHQIGNCMPSGNIKDWTGKLYRRYQSQDKMPKN